MIVTYKYRVKDKHARRLGAQAAAATYVWNFVNALQRKAFTESRRFFSGYDLQKYVAGATKEGLDLLATTAERVCLEYAKARRQARRPWLRWRSRKSLGWIPLKDDTIAFRDGAFRFRGERLDVWLDREPPAGIIGCGSFNQDARGRWYLNIPVEVPCAPTTSTEAVGLDLGLKALATCSNGERIAMPAYFRRSEARIAQAQRAHKPRLARNLRGKVAAQRRDYLHKASNALTQRFGLIVAGDVSASKLARTRMAKSVLDAGWSDFRRMLAYKSLRNGARYVEVSERFTTRDCSVCGSRTGPHGPGSLRVREWTCRVCGERHDRDVNAARNILRLGHQSPVEGAVAVGRRCQLRAPTELLVPSGTESPP